MTSAQYISSKFQTASCRLNRLPASIMPEQNCQTGSLHSSSEAVAIHLRQAPPLTSNRWIVLVVSTLRTTKAHLPYSKRRPEDEESNPTPPRTSQEAQTVPSGEDNWEKVEDTREQHASITNAPHTPERACLRQSISHHEELEAWCAMEQRIRNSRLSSLLDSPQSLVSREGSETSNFSALAFGLKKSPSSSKKCPRNMGEMSIAKLTSGVADGAWHSR